MEKSGKFRLTSLERNWILYDVGNSAFVLMVATLIPIFFNALAESGGLSSVEYLVTAARGRKGSITKDFLSWGIPLL